MKIYKAFDTVLGNIKFNNRFAYAINAYRHSYLDGSRDHLEFYGNFLTGHIPITFKTVYEHELYEDILHIDKNILIDARSNMENIDTTRKITSDIYNLTLFYIARRITLEKKLKKSVLKGLQKDLMLLFCYRTMSALHNNYYRHLLSKDLAEEVGNKLYNLFIVKRLGSWHKYMEYRADAVYNPSRKDFKRLLSTDDDAFLAVIVKIQGAIRDTMKKIYRVMLDVKKRSGGVSTRTIAINIDGDDDILEVTDDVESSINKVIMKMTTRSGYTDIAIIEALCENYLPGYKSDVVLDVMESIFKYQKSSSGKRVVKYIRDLISFYHHSRTIAVQKPKNIDELIRTLKGVLISSRSTEQRLLDLRKEGLYILRKATRRTNNQYLVKGRLAFNLYILVLYLK